MGRERALNRTEMTSVGHGLVVYWANSRRITKSPHFKMPPMLATHLLISAAIKFDSSFSQSNFASTGVAPSACEVCNDFGIRFLSEMLSSQYEMHANTADTPSDTMARQVRKMDAVER